MNRTYIHERLRYFGQCLIILAQSSISAQPSKGSFDNPTSGLNGKPCFRAFDHFVINPQPSLANVGHRRTIITLINNDPCPTLAEGDSLQQTSNPHLILDIGRVYHHGYQQTQGIGGDLSFTSLYFFAAIEAFWPPFSVVLTDWLSTMMVLG